MDSIPLLQKINQYIIDPLIWLIVTVSFLLFLYGVFEMIRGAGDPGARETGGRHIFWGVIGLFISISAVGILHLICNTIKCT